MPLLLRRNDTIEASSQTAMGALNRSPIVVRAKRKLNVVPKSRMNEADRGADGKLVSGAHSAQAREHMLAASISMNSGDYDEAARRLNSASIYTSHSPHAASPEALKLLQDAEILLKNGNADKAATLVEKAYSMLQGEPNHFMQMKKTRESDSRKGGRLIETLTFHPRFLEGTYDPVKRTVDVIIVTEGMGNSRDMHFYTPESIADAVSQKVFEGEQAYADHPSKFDDANRPERSVRDLIGYYFDSRLTETKDKRTGKLVAAYAAKFKIQQGLDWVDGIIREAIDFNKKFPDKTYVGISINADGDTIPGELDGVGTVNKVVKITEAFSADMVTKPARGGGFLKLVEGAGGASRQQLQGANMKGILDAAARLKELAGGAEVDPAELTALAESLTEADKTVSKEEAKESAGDIGDLSKKGSSDNKVGLNQMSEADLEEALAKIREGKKNDKSNDDPDNDGDGGGMFGESDKKETTGKTTESNGKGAGNLRESVDDLKKKFPSIYAAALREASATQTDVVKDLQRKNAQLTAELAMRESHDTGMRKLRESGIPERGFPFAIKQLLGQSPDEMDDTIASLKTAFFESDGGKRITGNGERQITLRESDVTSNTNAVLAGLTEE